MASRNRQDTERPLDLYEILEEEYAALHPDDDPRPPDAGTTIAYCFAIDDIRDVPALIQLICDGSTPVPDPSPTRAALTAIVQDQTTLAAEARRLRQLPRHEAIAGAGAFSRALIDRLNELVGGDVVTNPRFRELCRFAGVALPDDTAAARRPRANRLLLEAALAPAITRLRDVRAAALHARARPHAHTALCLSGGGIRSCSFALGVVTALARRDLLGKFDHLSTVSGGGYLGGFLSAWMRRDGAEAVHDALKVCTGNTLDPDPDPVRYLRAYTSYLAPRLGVLSADLWTLIGTLIRNLLLNWLVILPLLAGALMLPRAAVSFLHYPEELLPWTGSSRHALILLSVGAFALGAQALAWIFRYRPLPSNVTAPPTRPHGADTASRTQRAFMRNCLGPLVASALAFSFSWWLLGREAVESLPAWVWFGPAMAMGLVGWLIGSRPRRYRGTDALVVAVSGAGAGLIAPWILDLLKRIADDPALQTSLNLTPDLLRPRLYVTLAVPLFLLLILIGGQLFIGLSSTRSSNSEREWNARANAWLLIVMVTWVSVCGIVLFLPPLFENGWADPRLVGLHAIGGLSGLVTALLGASAATPSTSTEARGQSTSASVTTIVKRGALAVAAPVFAVSLVAVISVFNAQVLLHRTCAVVPATCHLISDTALTPVEADERARHPADYAPPLLVLLASIALIGGGWGLGQLVDTNQFSLHAMYRSRLVRTFLGASRSHADRSPDPFTGFDEDDDMPAGALWPPASTDGHARDRDDTMPPLHIVNLTLNVVAQRSLAWQQRKAESMTVSSLHAGGPFLGYRRTRPPDGEEPIYGGARGISLGTAITISGAAASPEAGYNSSPTVSFLMALFNARLGWWLGNPGPAGDRTFTRSGPRGGVLPVLSEMFGLTTDRNPFVFLSDGGHFDNLGLYSMVLRRCRLIVVSDAGCDPASTFDDLGNAIRKIRIDLGIPIEFPADRPPFGRTPATDDAAFTGWAVGRIRYSVVDAPASATTMNDDAWDGVLVYVKPTLCGGEPVDVVNYAHRSRAFPHESTTNQFFTESQFESYRSLGLYETERMCLALGLDADPGPAVASDADLLAAPMRWLRRQRTARTATV